MIKTNCFAYDAQRERCKALKRCKCDNCKFYKTKEEQQSQELNANKRAKTFGYYNKTKDYSPLGGTSK